MIGIFKSSIKEKIKLLTLNQFLKFDEDLRFQAMILLTFQEFKYFVNFYNNYLPLLKKEKQQNPDNFEEFVDQFEYLKYLAVPSNQCSMKILKI